MTILYSIKLYWKLPMGRKDTIFGEKYQKLIVGWHLLNYKEMFVETSILLWYVVIIIVIFTYMLAIEWFYLTQLCSFLGCFFVTFLLLLCIWPPVCVVCLNHEVAVFQPRAGTSPYLGSVANYTSYSNPPAQPVSTDFLDIFIYPYPNRPPHQ